MSYKTTDSSNLQPHQPCQGELGYMYIDDNGQVRSCDGHLAGRKDLAPIFYQMANQMTSLKLHVPPEGEETPDCIKVTYNDFYYLIAWDDKQILIRKIENQKNNSSNE